MSKLKFNPRTLILVLFILIVAAIRVVAPMLPGFEKIANYTAVGALSLFGGAYFKNNFKAFGFPLAALIISDLILSITVYKTSSFLYEGWYWTYITFALIVLAGKLLMNKVTIVTFLGGTIATVLIHWIVSDLGVWIGSTLYPQTIAGFWSCLVAAIPFEVRFLYGTLIYGVALFGGFESLKVKYPFLKTTQPVKA